MAISQPQRREGEAQFTDGNNILGHDLATSIQETFFAYANRNSDDNRSAQVHLGPSEIGTPCDRRIAMSLMGIRPVNPGGDGFAAWLGTQGHAGMAEIFEWADGRSGRYAVETKLSFPSKLVPRGTGDLLDRSFRNYGGVFIDWKFMGFYALKHLREYGASDLYRVQLQTYAFGAHIRGEKVKHIALVGMPRQGSSLSEMFVWTQPFDKSIGEAALRRVEEIDRQIRERGDRMDNKDLIASFPIADDCKYCDFYQARSTDLTHACNGKD